MTSFSIILNSDKTNFITSFSPVLELNQNHNYEIALVNLETYYSFPNITDQNNKFRYSLDVGVWNDIIIPTGSYELSQLNDEIFRIMKSRDHYDKHDNKSFISLGANFATLKCIIEISNPQLVINFDTDNSLRNVLGFNKQILRKSYNESDNPVNILSINSILVECSIIEGSYVNGIHEPILYSFFPKCLPGEKIIETPKNLIYLPLITKTISNIKIQLKDNNDNDLDLRGETITLRLHIRSIRE